MRYGSFLDLPLYVVLLFCTDFFIPSQSPGVQVLGAALLVRKWRHGSISNPRQVIGPGQCLDSLWYVFLRLFTDFLIPSLLPGFCRFLERLFW